MIDREQTKPNTLVEHPLFCGAVGLGRRTTNNDQARIRTTVNQEDFDIKRCFDTQRCMPSCMRVTCSASAKGHPHH